MSKPMNLVDTLRYVQKRIDSLIPVIEADMPLNEAAPEMLEVIAENGVSDALREMAKAIRTKDVSVIMDTDPKWCDAMADKLDAITAKARGEEGRGMTNMWEVVKFRFDGDERHPVLSIGLYHTQEEARFVAHRLNNELPKGDDHVYRAVLNR